MRRSTPIPEMRMHVGRLLVGVCGAALVCTTVAAQAPIGDMDVHISAAKAANPGLANPAVARAGGPGQPAGRGPDGGRGTGSGRGSIPRGRCAPAKA